MLSSAELAALAARLGDALRERPPRLGAGRLLCLDGPAGAGKTTVAAAVERELARRDVAVAVLHLDDLYDGWAGLEPSLEFRVRAQVLQPLAAGRSARWQRYDWHTGRFAEWHELPPPEVLVLEGCGAGARAYAPYISLLVWSDAPYAERRARIVARDGEEVLEHLPAWTALEAAHFAANATAARADVRGVCGGAPQGPGGAR